MKSWGCHPLNQKCIRNEVMIFGIVPESKMAQKQRCKRLSKGGLESYGLGKRDVMAGMREAALRELLV